MAKVKCQHYLDRIDEANCPDGPRIAREATSADAVKRDKPVMVVLGNPPYSGHSANKGQWIRGLLRGKDGVEDTGSYFEVDGGPLHERNPQWLNDDYVKFIRFAQWRIEHTGEGVLGFVTNHSYLDNPTFAACARASSKPSTRYTFWTCTATRRKGSARRTAVTTRMSSTSSRESP